MHVHVTRLTTSFNSLQSIDSLVLTYSDISKTKQWQGWRVGGNRTKYVHTTNY